MTIEIERAALTRIANIVRPALSTQSFIPALQHIAFDGEWATAYNDISAIQVKAKIELERCVPGEMLIRTLGSFSGEKVVLSGGKGGDLIVSSGRSKLKLPTIAAADFPFEMPEEQGHEVEITDDIIRGLERCKLSIGTNKDHPAQMGVTLDSEDGKAVLYSTDNYSISRYQSASKVKLAGDSPVILPTFFVDQLIALSKAFPEEGIMMEVCSDCLIATFGNEATLFTKTLVDLEPLDFPKIINKHLDPTKIASKLEMIPDAFDAAFSRALLVLSQEVNKSTKVSNDDGTLKLHSESQQGVSDDSMPFNDGPADMEFFIDPTLVVRASKVCTHMALLKNVMVMGDEKGKFLHLVAHCSE